MRQAIKTINTGHYTQYTDISDKVRKVRHSVIFYTEQRKEIEERIVEELYRIFTHKAD